MQLPVDDGKGYLVLPQVCAPLTQASSTSQYKLLDGSVGRMRDNVWAECTRCKPQEEFEARPCSSQRDAMCKVFTACDPDLEYVLRKGNAYHDTICARKTLCNAFTERGMYERAAAVDSKSFDVNGTDAVCAVYSRCPGGQYAFFRGNETSDVQCALCPAGTYRPPLSPSEACLECPAGTFASSPGSTECMACTRCEESFSTPMDLSRANPVESAWRCPPPTPIASCRVAASAPCSSDSDAHCALCAPGFEVTVDGICRACEPGYLYNESDPVEGRRCVPCPEGYYCPSALSAASPCEGRALLSKRLPDAGSDGGRMVMVDLVTVAVPWSPMASSRLSSCICSHAGGFELAPASGRGLGDWCIPCQAGKFAPAGATSCEACVAGTFSEQQTREWSDAVACTADAIRRGTCEAHIVSGATECVLCPSNRPYTRGTGGAASEDDCHPCPEEHFFSEADDVCVPCAPPCLEGQFEVNACTEYGGDRECATCKFDACNAVLEYVDYERGCPGAVAPDRPCAPCTEDMKPQNSTFVDAGGSFARGDRKPCAWRCDDGYYSPPGSETCIPCTVLTSGNCRPGYVPTACSAHLNVDASCTQECDAEALGKPSAETSDWVWTLVDGASGALYENVASSNGADGRPNAGCMWKCKPGFVQRFMPTAGDGSSGLNFCVQE